MAIGPKLTLRQSTSLVMTPQLQQAIKLLQLSNLELSTYVEQELEQNPLLEREDSDREEVARAESVDGDVKASVGEEPGEVRDTADMAGNDSMPSEGEGPLDTDFGNVWSEDGAAGDPEAFANWSGGSGGRSDFEDGEYNLEHTLSKDVSLRDHLLAQINIEIDEPADRLIGIDLIEMLDEAGYLVGGLADVADRLGCDIALVESTLVKLQRFDPPGVFARSLSECLALQLRELNRLDPAIQALLDNLDLLAKRDLVALRKICAVDNEDLTQMIEEIRALDPKPGLAFDAQVAQPVTPDVLVKPHPKGGWQVELNAETLPRVLVNQTYYAKVTKDVRNKHDKDYIADRLQSANWLVRSLHQRATTILKVASEIVRRQEGFFQHGVQHLRPLTLRDIAAVIDMHESTVSRVTTNKYMATPRGIYEMKYFFTSAIANSVGGGDAHSAEAVRSRIKELIDAELAAEVLSDDRIVEILNGQGIDIARRTVAKYREAMRIPSSVQRRREKTSSL
ncbi:MAG TPA: RNA polymerase factor sigma-54 [Alphaproteobacteria bacterium]|jgi:RNA polymerase sigma-54 factor